MEIAGVRLAIEVPAALSWDWSGTRLLDHACSPIEADIHVGVRVATPRPSKGESILYRSSGTRFEIGKHDGDWFVNVFGNHGCERTARFDAKFRKGEVVVCPERAEQGQFPLAHPLDELLVLHRIVRDGGLVLRGSMKIREGRAQIFLSPPREEAGGESGSAVGGAQRHLVLRRGQREQPGQATTRGPVWVYTTPWGGSLEARVPQRAPLAEIHVLDAGAERPSPILDEAEAIAAILPHVFAPIHDAEAADRVMTIAVAMIQRISVKRMSQPELKRAVSFIWEQSQASFGFAAPRI